MGQMSASGRRLQIGGVGMPGYVMHLAEVRMVIDEIEKTRALDRDWIEAFKTGNLLPDTRLFDEKLYSHFWDPEEAEHLERVPVLQRFLDKYGDRLDQPVLLGYLMHLHLDHQYVESFWPENFFFYNKEGEREKIKSRITYVKLHRSGQEIPLEKFFSGEYYYGDYNRMNDHFIKDYGIGIPDWSVVKDFPMTEVKLEDMAIICGHMEALLAEGHVGTGESTRVFDIRELEQFMMRTAMDFIKQYRGYFGV